MKDKNNVIQLFPKNDAPTALRNIAALIEKGEIAGDSIAVVSIPDIFMIGHFEDNDPATEFIFNMQYGIQKMMSKFFN